MSIDFDTVIDRRGTSSIKWDKYADRNDVIAMWVADMDFQSPAPVLTALHQRIEHGVFGYTPQPPVALVEIVVEHLKRCYHWSVDPEWLVWLPGLVCGLNVTCRAVGEPGDAILSATPVYYHLFKAPQAMSCETITAPMALDGQRWQLDFDRMTAAVTPRTRLFMLCNPHNPVGRVYSRAELLQLADWCEQHDLLLCSDEIHCQLILDQSKTHIPIASLDPAIAARTITLMAPSKTYNLPGLGCAFAIISNATLRTSLYHRQNRHRPACQCSGLYRSPGSLSRWRALVKRAAGLFTHELRNITRYGRTDSRPQTHPFGSHLSGLA